MATKLPRGGRRINASPARVSYFLWYFQATIPAPVPSTDSSCFFDVRLRAGSATSCVDHCALRVQELEHQRHRRRRDHLVRRGAPFDAPLVAVPVIFAPSLRSAKPSTLTATVIACIWTTTSICLSWFLSNL